MRSRDWVTIPSAEADSARRVSADFLADRHGSPVNPEGSRTMFLSQITRLRGGVQSLSTRIKHRRKGLPPVLEMLELRQIPSAVQYTAVAAGDPTSDSAVLWTRALDPEQLQPVELLAEVSTDPSLNVINGFYAGKTDPDRDYTVKVEATGLRSDTQYYYRFRTYQGVASPVGTFRTAPDPAAAAPVHFGFSGDADGKWRPYDVTANFADQGLDFFVFLGDTIYESSNARSAGTTDPYDSPAQALMDFRRKYRENLQPVNPGGFSSLRTLFASQGNYTLLDNHELGNRQFQCGGAPTGVPSGKGVDSADPGYDVNSTGSFMHQTQGFSSLLQAFRDYQPIRERILQAPDDPRSDQTYQQYFCQQWGRNSIFFNVDTRSYRDIRMTRPEGGDDTGPRADNPDRTMLGRTQLQWLEQSLLEAKENNITWKFVAISSPIDQTLSDNGKTWNGGYRAERQGLLRFIADNHIDHVIFLTTDDHVVRVNEVDYLTDPTDPTTRTRVPGCFMIVAGPLGGAGPDGITNHSFNNIKSLANSRAANETAHGLDPLGLDAGFPGLHDVNREGDPDADTLRQPADFYSPDTFNYVNVDISPDGSNLTVSAFGINSYPANMFLEPGQIDPERLILSFQVCATTSPSGRAFVPNLFLATSELRPVSEPLAHSWTAALALPRLILVAPRRAIVDRVYAAADEEQAGWHHQEVEHSGRIEADWNLCWALPMTI